MKIILLQDVYKKGVAGEVVNVAPGFARNYLIPRGMAAKATPGSLRQSENLRKQADVRRAERDKEYGAIAEKVQALRLYFGVKAGESGKLYGSVTSAEIAEQLKHEIGLDIDRRRIGDQPLRELGEVAVPVRLDAGLIPHVQVVVYREGHDPRQMTEAEAAAEAEYMAEAEYEAGAEYQAEAEYETEAEYEVEAGAEDLMAESDTFAPADETEADQTE
jgi:large subunit ribosomal protein L9